MFYFHWYLSYLFCFVVPAFIGCVGTRLLPGLPERACHLRHCLPGSPGQLGLCQLSDPKVNVQTQGTSHCNRFLFMMELKRKPGVYEEQLCHFRSVLCCCETNILA